MADKGLEDVPEGEFHIFPLPFFSRCLCLSHLPARSTRHRTMPSKEVRLSPQRLVVGRARTQNPTPQ
jgi:hypothetical protein